MTKWDVPFFACVCLAFVYSAHAVGGISFLLELGRLSPFFFENMDAQDILKRVEEVVSPVLDNLGYELVERELLHDAGRLVLRLYIDHGNGVTIDDCERASRSIEDLLEVEEVVPAAYCLEVSSPGLNRPLRKKQDFERFKGNKIKLKTSEPIDGRGNFKGLLQGVDGDDILILIDGVQFRVPISLLLRARIDK